MTSKAAAQAFLDGDYGYKFGGFDPEKHSIFRVDGPMGSGAKLEIRMINGTDQGFPPRSKSAHTPGSSFCAVYFAPKDACEGVVYPYSIEEVVEFVRSTV